MSASLQQLLSQQPPGPSGVHESMARHSESIFSQFKGILPQFLGKRKSGPFVNLTLPNAVIQDTEILMQTLSDLVWVYDLSLISFVSAIRMQNEESGISELKAVLITADKSHAYFQLPWKLDFDPEGDIIRASRDHLSMDVVPREIWSQLFASKISETAKILSFERLVERFGGEDELPKP